MKVLDFINDKISWLENIGKDGDLVISSRIRLARNLADFNFPHRCVPEKLEQVISTIKTAVNNVDAFRDGYFYELDSFDAIKKQGLMERHLISHEHMECKKAAVAISKDQNISLMINEEDHIRLQVFMGGLQLNACWQMINEIDDALSANLKYAHLPDLGYLTACPTNVGTGIRASVLIHLPALCITKQIGRLFDEVIKLGISIRGLYGEGTESKGEIFQISNQVTLGRNEQEFVENVQRVTEQIINYERQAQESLKKDIRMEDKIMRAWGTLLYAKMMSTTEALKLLSLIRLGLQLKIAGEYENKINYAIINKLFILLQPAHIQLYGGSSLEPQARDRKRVEVIHKVLDGNV